MQARSFCVGLVLLGVGLLPPVLRADDLPPEPQGVEVQARGPVHEAFAPLSAEPVETKPVAKQPPEPLEELAPEEKPEGEVVWIKGYWAWDEDRSDYLWVSGTWRVSPPNKQWIPGYWRENNGWQWVPGFWTTSAKDPAASPDISYLPPPPPAPPLAPPGTAPAPNTFFVPGHYVWSGTDYVWRAPYWARCEPNYVWVAAHYRWTPSGYIYVEGYWDLAVSKRGFLYAPVIIRPEVVTVSFSYTPVYAVRDTVVLDSLFVCPVACHYYFGDYYGTVYTDRGFESCYVYSQRNYDPIIVYEAPRRDPSWISIQITLGNDRAAGRAPLPPRTLAQQTTIINQTVINQTVINQNTTNITNTNITNTNITNTNVANTNVANTNKTNAPPAMLAPAAAVAKEKGVTVTKMDPATRRAAVQQAVALQQSGPARGKAEASAPPVTKGMAPRSAKLETVRTQAVKPGFVPPTPKANVSSTVTKEQQHPSGEAANTQHPTTPGTHPTTAGTTPPAGTHPTTAGTTPPGTHPATAGTTPPTGTHPATQGATSPEGTHPTTPGTTPPTGTHPATPGTTPPTGTHPATPGTVAPPAPGTHPATGTTTPPMGTHPATPGTVAPPAPGTHPATGTTTPPMGTHPATPGTTSPMGTHPATPGTTPPMGTRPATPATQPGSQRPGQPGTQPGTTPAGRPGQPGTQPGTTPPGQRPAQPGTTPPGTPPGTPANGQPGTAPATNPLSPTPGH